MIRKALCIGIIAALLILAFFVAVQLPIHQFNQG